MNVPAELLALLRERTGLDPEILGAALLERVWARHKGADARAALAQLALGGEDWTRFLDELVVPETWLFREEKSFDFLLRWLREEWAPRHAQTRFQALSFPCASGEEAYSIAATALEAGLPVESVHVDARDISRGAIAAGKRAFYRGRSIRVSSRRGAHRYFEAVDGGLRAGEALRRCVEFRVGNILNAGGLGTHYAVLFCRNLLIYMTREARAVTLANLCRLLAPNGVLFLGHADTAAGLDDSFERIQVEGAFAYCHRGVAPKNALKKEARAVPAHSARPVSRSVSGVRKTRMAARPRSSTELLERARKLADSGAVQEARREVKELLRAHSNSAEAWYLLGLLHSAAGETSEAEACYERTLALEPGNADAALHLSLLVDERDATPARNSSRRRQ